MAPPNTIGPPVCTDLIKQTAIELPQQIIKSHGKDRKLPFFLPEIFHLKKIWKLKLIFSGEHHGADGGAWMRSSGSK